MMKWMLATSWCSVPQTVQIRNPFSQPSSLEPALVAEQAADGVDEGGGEGGDVLGLGAVLDVPHRHRPDVLRKR